MTTLGAPIATKTTGQLASTTTVTSKNVKPRGGKKVPTINIDGEIFTVIKKLGKGAYGTVERVEDSEHNSYAVKRVEYKPIHGCYADIIKEMDILRRFGSHPNIIKLCGYAWREHEFLVLMEYGGTPLHRYISNVEYEERKQLFPMVLWQILSALEHLHANGIAHRDVKPDNMLVQEFEEDNGELTPYLRLCDFGLSKNMTLKRNTPKTSTLWYRAPENLQKLDRYGYKIDIWAVGCLVYEYMTGRVLFEANSSAQCLLMILSSLGPIADETYSKLRIDKSKLPKRYRKHTIRQLEDPTVHRLMLDMLSVDPDKRPSAAQLLQHPFFSGPNQARVTRVQKFIQDETVRRQSYPHTPPMPDVECPSFTPDVRRALVQWLIEIQHEDEEETRPETLMLGVALFDEVMTKWGPLQNDSDLKYIALCCLNIASKYLEIGLDLDFIYTWNNRQFHIAQGVAPNKVKDPSSREIDNYISNLNNYEQRCLMLLDFRIGGRETPLDRYQGDFNKAKRDLLR
jgi:serine/threonine protein kinase